MNIRNFPLGEKELCALKFFLCSPDILPFDYSFPPDACAADLECETELQYQIRLIARLTLKGKPFAQVHVSIGKDSSVLTDMTFDHLDPDIPRFSREACRRMVFWAWQMGFKSLSSSSVDPGRPQEGFREVGFELVSEPAGGGERTVALADLCRGPSREMLEKLALPYAQIVPTGVG